VYPELLTINTFYEGGEAQGYVGVFSDISTLKEQQDKLTHLAHHDPLTDLPNRVLLTEKLEHSIRISARNNRSLALMFIDLDRFKHVNDSMGHPVGDTLLRHVAQRLCVSIRESDTVARISGDEFVVIVEDAKNVADVTHVARHLLHSLQDTFIINDIEISVTASIGISMYPQDAQDIAYLMAHADAAMYKAKESGKNTFTFYSSEFTSQAAEFVYMENALKKALVKEQFFLLYQPQFSADLNEIVGVEALIRWQHPSDGLISPDRFIPIAEQNGTIRDIGKWVLNTACKQAAQWQKQGYKLGKMAVNLSAVQFYNTDFVEEVVGILEQTALSASSLELEITESLVMDNTDEAIKKLQRFRQMGISVSLDDFGTGYSSLSYLKQLPIDRLKIDRSFINDIPDDEDDKAITDAIIGLAKTLKLEVIAEGVETESQVAFLGDKNCDYQGYYFSKPLPASELPDFIKGFNNKPLTDN
jgi:diguanylate cyclase (GGDEF)-like protein